LPTERVLQVGFLQVMHIHVVAFLLRDVFYVFEGDFSWWKRDWPQHFQV